MIMDDDGELEYSSQVLFTNDENQQLQSNCSIDDEFFKDFIVDNHACTHTHTCNPPGPDSSHTHTCFHVHTKILPAPSDDKGTTDDTADSVDKKSKKRPTGGNREAVRKYREKKKARANSLEDEVMRLKDLNQQLMKRLQNQAVLEAEVTRLKCLLVDIRGRIEGEIGSFPYQKPTKFVDGMQNLSYPNLGGGACMVNPCDYVRCDDQVHCMHPGMENKGSEEVGGGFNGEEFGACNVGYAQCSTMGNTSLAYKELPGCGVANSVPALNYLAANKRKGARGPNAG